MSEMTFHEFKQKVSVCLCQVGQGVEVKRGRPSHIKEMDANFQNVWVILKYHVINVG